MSAIKRSLDSDSHTEAPAAKKRTVKKKPAATIGTCSLNKKDFGDKIKSCLRLEKFEAQRMLIQMDMDHEFFQDFFGGGVKGVMITPTEYDDKTPVVVAALSNAAAGEIFGVSKVKGGNRYATVHLAAMVVILYPASKKAQAWLTV